mmetsp:Transcript_2908/g.5296  ORF Transcript_2908/g.5296 Transcript_2908/m.5296 type:complete len:240 (+) Transcript_2908:1729-2448(+)
MRFEVGGLLRGGELDSRQEHEIRRSQRGDEVSRGDRRGRERHDGMRKAHPEQHRLGDSGPASAGVQPTTRQKGQQIRGAEKFLDGDGIPSRNARRLGLSPAVRGGDLRARLDRQPSGREDGVRAQDPIQKGTARSAPGLVRKEGTRRHGQAGSPVRLQAGQHLSGRRVHLHAAVVDSGGGAAESYPGGRDARGIAGDCDQVLRRGDFGGVDVHAQETHRVQGFEAGECTFGRGRVPSHC